MNALTLISNALTAGGTFSDRVDKLTDHFIANGGYESTKDANHFFGKNLYLRELSMKRGTAIAGRVHKYDHVFILMKGRLSIWSETGRQVLKAPAIFECKAGVQRVGYVHEDVVCMTAHGTVDQDRDPEAMWDLLTLKDDKEFKLLAGILDSETCHSLPQEQGRLGAPDAVSGS